MLSPCPCVLITVGWLGTVAVTGDAEFIPEVRVQKQDAHQSVQEQWLPPPEDYKLPKYGQLLFMPPGVPRNQVQVYPTIMGSMK